jgi:hypothetical protein
MGRYFAVLKRSMDYIQCVESESRDEMLAKVHLVVTAWESLCRFKNLEYKRAYKHAFKLRYEKNCSGQNNNNNNNNNNYDETNAIASATNRAEVKQAIEYQIKIAEQCTTCQKKLYLVHKWQRRVLAKAGKQALIEPQGYQAIRRRRL